jgi:hypothetical protein
MLQRPGPMMATSPGSGWGTNAASSWGGPTQRGAVIAPELLLLYLHRILL